MTRDFSIPFDYAIGQIVAQKVAVATVLLSPARFMVVARLYVEHADGFRLSYHCRGAADPGETLTFEQFELVAYPGVPAPDREAIDADFSVIDRAG